MVQAGVASEVTEAVTGHVQQMFTQQYVIAHGVHPTDEQIAQYMATDAAKQ